jgi:hypothetical protein
MKFSEYLASSKGFGRLLTELARDFPDLELLEDSDWTRLPALPEFLTRRWARDRVAGSDRRAAFVLLVAYATAMLVEQVRFGCKRYLRLGAMLFLAQFVWPPYQVWVGRLPPLPGQRSLSACLSWLTAPGRLSGALRDLGVPDPQAAELQVSAQDLDRDRSTLYGWLAQARDLVYRQILRELDQDGPGLHDSAHEGSAARQVRCELPVSYSFRLGRRARARAARLPPVAQGGEDSPTVLAAVEEPATVTSSN